ncbi:MAG: alpha-glucosidase/alpha-galactosidase [Dehalococcoidales bacterium]|nr:MAG: alpha-glucosidase/alpha-galactosidase [Dehalococcoidales bacterium]
MTKIAFVGAGSVVFATNLLFDILSFPELGDVTISLMDVDSRKLDMITKLAHRVITQEKLKADIETTLERRDALQGADFVITMFQIGGVAAFEPDINIPLKYGVKQAVGDTLGPGGVFRFLRTAPVLMSIAEDMDELCPNALWINYVNPMAMNCWYVNRISGIKNVGLCHSVQGTSAMLARRIGASIDDISFTCAGINHMAWFLEYKWKGEDAYPMIRARCEDPEVYKRDVARIEILKAFGYYVTESSYHMSEYVPYFRKSADWINLIHRDANWNDKEVYDGMVLQLYRDQEGEFERRVEKLLSEEHLELTRSDEYGAFIIHSIVTDTPTVIHGNVENKGLITNLPEGCCVEVPCLVDRNGISPTPVGSLPVQLAALNLTNINVQELAVEAAITGKKDAVYQAITMDPLTSAVLTLPEIHDMVGEMFEAEKEWLPQFD